MDISFAFRGTLLRISVFLSVAILAVLTTTWVVTTLNFRRRLSNPQQDGEKADKEPVTMPYAIPWLGSALSFLNEQGTFYDSILAQVGSTASMCTVRLGPEKSYIALSAAAVEAMFQSTRYISSDRFVRMIIHHGFNMPLEDVNKILKKYPKTSEDTIKAKPMYSQDPIMQRYLISQDAVNVLTAKFIEVFNTALENDTTIPAKGEATVDLYEWVKGRMFVGSTTSIFGSYILEVYPDIGKDFFAFDSRFLKIVYGTPKFLAGDVYTALKRLLKGTEQWLNKALPKLEGQLDPTEGPDWEPYLGCRLQRGREKLFAEAGLSMKAKASQQVGLLFGVTSNAIPATGWMLFHILSSPHDLLPRILSEISTAHNPHGAGGGTLDIPTLLSLPLFLSTYTEVLRMYVAVNVTREVHGDFVIDGHLLKKGNTIMAPSWLGHRDPKVWNNLHPEHPPVDVFYAERFLRQNEEGGKVVCSTTGLSGKYFPYGGGAHICPGRVFAKQEILAAVATVLLNFDFEFVSWVDHTSKDKKGRFPRIRKGYVGNGVMAADGDMRVRIKRKN